MQLGPEQTGIPTAPGVYAVRVRTGIFSRAWLWAAWDGRGWSMAQDAAGDASRLLGADGRIPSRMYARTLPTMWRPIIQQVSVADALRGARGG